jgi:hypothetical protein
MSSEPELRFRDSSWASISAVDFLGVTAGSRGMRSGSRLRPLWLILSLDDPMNYSGGLYTSHVWRGRLAVFGGGASVKGKKLGWLFAMMPSIANYNITDFGVVH